MKTDGIAAKVAQTCHVRSRETDQTLLGELAAYELAEERPGREPLATFDALDEPDLLEIAQQPMRRALGKAERFEDCACADAVPHCDEPKDLNRFLECAHST